MDPILIFVHPVTVSGRGTVFNVTLDAPDGELIVERVKNPEHVAARVLVERGLGVRPLQAFAPSLSVARKWTPTIRFKSVSGAAKMHTQEVEKTGPRVVKHKPFAGIAPRQAIAA